MAVQAEQAQPNFKKQEKEKEKQKSGQSFLPGYGPVDSEIKLNLIKKEKAKMKTKAQTEVAKLK